MGQKLTGNTKSAECSICYEDTANHCPYCNTFLCDHHLAYHEICQSRNQETASAFSERRCNNKSQSSSDTELPARENVGQENSISENGTVKPHTENYSNESKQQTTVADSVNETPTKAPGKPDIIFVSADTISLTWEKPVQFGEDDHYQVSYKMMSGTKPKWKPCLTEFRENSATLTDLKSNTEFQFRVRVVYEEEEEGPYSPPSDPVKTILSLAISIRESAEIAVADCVPEVRYLPKTLVKNSRQEKEKRQKFEFGSPRNNVNGNERTIMLVGETGSGKSTMLDGIVNYFLGVNWDDPVRYTIVHLEKKEKEKQSQAISQTDWITCYSLHPTEGSRLDFSLNIIDTPGFGDTRGLKRDEKIKQRIFKLFSSRDESGILGIDAVCFLLKAPDARLTATQNYIFESVMSLFAKDIEKNICSLVTFADGTKPPVFASMDKSDLPFGKRFLFNNSGLFASNVDLQQSDMSQNFWDMGIKSFKAFFEHLSTLHTSSLEKTKTVLETRKTLENTVSNLLLNVNIGITKLANLKDQIKRIEQHELDIKQNKDFLIENKVPVVEKHNTKQGQYVTNCLICNYTCHKRCAIPDNEMKQYCAAMTNGNCTECTKKCNWKVHVNNDFFFEVKFEIVKELFSEKEAKYKTAETGRSAAQVVVSGLKKEIQAQRNNVNEELQRITDCNNRLKEIAIRPDPLTLVDQIELLIQSEKSQNKPGCSERIEELYKRKKQAQYNLEVDSFMSGSKN